MTGKITPRGTRRVANQWAERAWNNLMEKRLRDRPTNETLAELANEAKQPAHVHTPAKEAGR